MSDRVPIARLVGLLLAEITSRFSVLVPRLDVKEFNVHVGPVFPDEGSLRIAQISDLHVGHGSWWPLRAREAVDAVMASRPHIVVNTGDYFQWNPDPRKVVEAALPFVLAPRTDIAGPVNLAVLGNHDYYAGEDHILHLTQLLQRSGVCVLTNEIVEIEWHGVPLTFIGLWLDAPGMEEAIARIPATPRPRIVLVHDPEAAEHLADCSVDLVLCGHTHGGQITLPLLTRSIVRWFNGSRYIEGWYRINGNRVYVNRGLGCTGFPWRFRAAPEVTVFSVER